MSRLYALRGATAGPGDDPYARYNALCREHDSFLDALEAKVRRERA